MLIERISEGAADELRIKTILTTGATVSDAAAATAVAFPAGGTGAAAGGWDTAGNRDLAITRFAALLADVAGLRAQMNALLAELRTRKIIGS